MAATKLQIGYQRICDCPDRHINCLTAKEWLKAQLGVWEFYYEGRDIRDKDLHPATFPIALSSRCIELFTHEGELVLDPFLGSGTTLVSARDLNRNAVGFDLKPEYIHLAEERCAEFVAPHHLQLAQLFADLGRMLMCYVPFSRHRLDLCLSKSLDHFSYHLLFFR